MDYDLIVIGISDATYRLVIQAAHLGARVGWIVDQKYDQYPLMFGLDHGWDLLASLSIINTNLRSKLICLSAKHLNQKDTSIFEAMANIKGVDVIENQKENQNKNQKEPQAYIYAIASSIAPFPRQVLGLAEHPYVTVADICDWVFDGQDQSLATILPSSIAILGNDSLACTIAQITNLLGIHTVLLVDHQHILPHVDVKWREPCKQS